VKTTPIQAAIKAATAGRLAVSFWLLAVSYWLSRYAGFPLRFNGLLALVHLDGKPMFIEHRVKDKSIKLYSKK
jgi:hypothetical protein